MELLSEEEQLHVIYSQYQLFQIAQWNVRSSNTWNCDW